MTKLKILTVIAIISYTFYSDKKCFNNVENRCKYCINNNYISILNLVDAKNPLNDIHSGNFRVANGTHMNMIENFSENKGSNSSILYDHNKYGHFNDSGIYDELSNQKNKKLHKRFLISYKMGNNTETEQRGIHSVQNFGSDNHTIKNAKLINNSRKIIRNSALNELKNKVRRFAEAKKTNHNNSPELLTQIHINQTDPVDSSILRMTNDESGDTYDFKSQYLESLHMEIISIIPSDVEIEEIKMLAENVSGVERIYNDQDKFQDYSNDIFLLSREVEELALESDSKNTLQWGLSQQNKWSIQAESTWKIWDGEKNPFPVAIIDSGCDITNLNIKNNIWVNPNEICYDGIDNDNNGYIDDCYGWDFVNGNGYMGNITNNHGTNSAGLIAAKKNYEQGISGVCLGCKIMCLKFIENGFGSVIDETEAINYAITMGVWISSNSYGSYGYSDLEFDAVKRAESAGHLFVTSVGNDGLNIDLPMYNHTPSSYGVSNIISVGAIDETGARANFSNYGIHQVDVMAPGARLKTITTNGGYSFVYGTSFSSSIVAGAAALLWSAFPYLSYYHIKKALMQGCKVSVSLANSSGCGGSIDLLHSFFIAALMVSGSYEEEAYNLRRT